MTLIYFVFFLILVEICLFLIVNSFRRQFQWLITEADDYPVLDKKGLEKFFQHGFDPYLGWVRKPNTKGIEHGCCGQVSFTIDSRGARLNPLAAQKDEVIATFGDSYTFCRQVNDNETWQFYLTQGLNLAVSNYGVGNYGPDQSLLRYEKTELPSSVKIVILAFVPEAICRIQSYWKHYLEFGNTFAFKPRFILDGGELRLLPNPMQSEKDFFDYKKKLPGIRANDGFYKLKFRRLQFRFPYFFSFIRNFRRNTLLLGSLLRREFARRVKKASLRIENAPFEIVMNYNIRQSHMMYEMDSATDLFKAVLNRFKNAAYGRGHKPIILITPQLIDLRLSQGGEPPYRKFFRNLDCGVPIIDLSGFLLEHKLEDLYINDFYGGHFSREGNKAISSYLSAVFKKPPLIGVNFINP